VICDFCLVFFFFFFFLLSSSSSKMYHNVWVANEAVDFLCERFSLTREGSVQLMCELQRRGFIEYVKCKERCRFCLLLLTLRKSETKRSIRG
jgi:hypothetical protein